ncbi:sugar ABC transporter permease, partial [bacterium]|nr:sugar ABC transporter permease [bacterium]
THSWLGEPGTALWAIIFMGIPWVGAFPFLIYYGGLISIPSELFDAAKVDGANTFQRFFRIDLPLLLGQIKLLIVLTYIGTMQDFTTIFIMTGGGPASSTYVPALQLYYSAMRFNKFGYASAIATVLFIVLLIGTIINMKYIRSSVEYQG